MLDCEVVIHKMNQRGTRMLNCMVEAAEDQGVRCKVTKRYKGSSEVLMTYGLGHIGRRPAINRHLKSGGRLIGWDLGYWDRMETMRLTIDHDHPHRLLTDMPAGRFEASRLKMRNYYNSSGHIVLVGMGQKSRMSLGLGGQRWEKAALRRIRDAYPGRRILYKPKKLERFEVQPYTGTIEQALRGAALVVCRHSNVTVDACIAGVPAVCEDGAGFALYNNKIKAPVIPDMAERLRFLQNLAWWQWKESECAEAWQFIKERL